MCKLIICAAVLLVSALSAGLASAGPVTKAVGCGVSSGMLVNVKVGDCDGTELCTVPIGQEHPVEISFLSNGTFSEQVQFQLWFYRPFGSVSPLLSVPLEGISLIPGTEYTFTEQVIVPDRFVGVSGEFDVVLYDMIAETQIICGEVLVSITEATTETS